MGVKKTSGKYIKFFIYLIVVILINVAGVTLFFRGDLTRSDIYSISDVSKRVVSTISEPLTIKVFFTKNLPAPHNSTERYLRDLLEEYSVSSNKYYNYKFYDVSPEEDAGIKGTGENRELAKSYGIYPIQIQLVEKDEIKFKNAYMGMVLIHGDIVERIHAITTTEGLEYEITTAIQKMNNKISALLKLAGKVKVDLYLSSSLKAVAPLMGLKELPEFPNVIEGVVKELNDKNYDTLEFRYFDPTKENNLEELSEKFNFSRLKWQAVPENNLEAGEGVIGLVMKYGGRTLEIPLLNIIQIPIIGTQYDLVNPKRLETIIEANLETLIGINENLGYLADHGTLTTTRAAQSPPGVQPREPLTIFNNLVSKNYSIKDVNLKEGPISGGFKTLVIASPQEKFTDYELYQIDQLLMRGKNLAIFADAFNEILPSPQNPYQQQPVYVPMDTGLEKLLKHYGISIKNSYVMDKSSYKQRLPKEYGGGEKEIYFAPIIKQDSINKELDFMQNIKGLVTIKISPLELDEKRISDMGIKAVKVISSSDQSWEMKDRIDLNPMMLKPPKADEKMESKTLACLLEGEFTSYFKGKPMPAMTTEAEKSEKKGENDTEEEKPQKEIDRRKIEGESAFIEKGRPAKIFVVTSSELLKDSMLDEEGKSPNAMFVLNVLDYLNDRGDIASMRSKEQGFNPLYETDSAVKTLVKAFNIAVLPILVALFGIFIMMRRHARKKRIQAMFQK
ncbi:MAG: Gldg family protein [Deltaproteobacteria bacterium]|nr:Gldg family protein [Deltaproteobacteria bacterium]